MKLVVRADDFGYTDVCNIGTARCVEEGVVTHMDTMLDCPGVEDALRRLKDWPWISIGWHTHFWGYPALPVEQVSTLIDKSTGKFRVDLHTAEDISFDEMLAECHAQVERCVAIAGRAPDVVSCGNTTIFERALRHTADEFGIVHDFMRKTALPGRGVEAYPDEKYRDLDIFMPSPKNAYALLYSDGIQRTSVDSNAAMLAYDPVKYYIDDPDDLKSHKVAIQAWHPGYVDDFVYYTNFTNPSKLFPLARIWDMEALCSERMRDWIKESGTELINLHDAVYGTSQYQDHLKATGSDLYMQ